MKTTSYILIVSVIALYASSLLRNEQSLAKENQNALNEVRATSRRMAQRTLDNVMRKPYDQWDACDNVRYRSAKEILEYPETFERRP